MIQVFRAAYWTGKNALFNGIILAISFGLYGGLVYLAYRRVIGDVSRLNLSYLPVPSFPFSFLEFALHWFLLVFPVMMVVWGATYIANSVGISAKSRFPYLNALSRLIALILISVGIPFAVGQTVKAVGLSGWPPFLAFVLLLWLTITVGSSAIFEIVPEGTAQPLGTSVEERTAVLPDPGLPPRPRIEAK